jgi:hypothetical protein
VLGALILLSLIVYLALALHNRRTKVGSKRGKSLKVQPKFSAASELNELSSSGQPAVHHEKNAAISQLASGAASAARAGAQSGVGSHEPATASPVNASHQSQWVLTKPTITTPTATTDEHREEEEREVFEL